MVMSAYRAEVEQLTGWCRDNNLVLNTTKTKDQTADFQRKKTEGIHPLYISGEYVERVSDFRFLGIQIEEDLSWSANTSVTIVSFYRCSIENVLTDCVCVVCQLHSPIEESTPEGHHHRQEDHWLLSPLPR